MRRAVRNGRRGGAATPAEEERALDGAILDPTLLSGSWRIVVAGGPKGGVGKTPAAALCGSLLSARGEIVAVADADPHGGSLRDRLTRVSGAPLPWLDLADVALRDALRPEWPVLSRYSDLVGRMRVFSNADANPARVEAMSGAQYTAMASSVTRAAEVLVSDMGTSVTGEVSRAALDSADQLLVCTQLQRDAVTRTVEWLTALAGEPMPSWGGSASLADGRYRDLVSRAVIVISPGGGDVDGLSPMLSWLGQLTHDARTGSGPTQGRHNRLVTVPFDPHIAAGDVLDVAALLPATRLAFKRVTAQLTANFSLAPLAWPRNPGQPGVAVPVTGPRPGLGPSPARTQPVRPGRAADPATGRTAPAGADAISTPFERLPATFSLGQDLPTALRVGHAVGEVCSGACGDAACQWPVHPAWVLGELDADA
ncbi:MAG: hypothetical protein JWN95_1360 [Frankiales bacterium]|nr:hypothetical protein [Frankiales bacterium]